MPFVSLWIHLIWTTKNRQPVMTSGVREKIFDHIKENAKQKNIYLDCIDGVADHVHGLISLNPDQSVSTVARLLKGESSHWANEKKILPGKFEWQDEYMAFSVSEYKVPIIRNYIRKQEEHHRTKTFAQEYAEIMKEYQSIGG